MIIFFIHFRQKRLKTFAIHSEGSEELKPFRHVVEFSKRKVQSVKASLEVSENQGLRFIFMLEGRFEWILEGEKITVYPNDLLVIYPKQLLGSQAGNFDNGTFYSLTIKPELVADSHLVLGDWSSISESEQYLIGKMLLINKKSELQNFKSISGIFRKLEFELFTGEIGYQTIVNHLIDKLIIYVTRQLNQQENQKRTFPQTFEKFDQILRENLSHPWTVEEMATVMGIGTTTLNEKVKSYSGFTPVQYFMSIRISESIRLLKSTNMSLTDIAMEMGFYSSQHFSSTFKKLTGYTPSFFRKKPNTRASQS
ncbi:MAG: AraC family transcriptional regulator [Spirosomataceae bacterium]